MTRLSNGAVERMAKGLAPELTAEQQQKLLLAMIQQQSNVGFQKCVVPNCKVCGVTGGLVLVVAVHVNVTKLPGILQQLKLETLQRLPCEVCLRHHDELSPDTIKANHDLFADCQKKGIPFRCEHGSPMCAACLKLLETAATNPTGEDEGSIES